MDIVWMAKMKTYEEFLESFQKGDEKKEHIFIRALGNTTPSERYKISKFLIDKGADVTELGPQGYSSLQVLLAQVKHNLEETLELCKILIDRGVDINHKDMHGQVPFVYVLRLPQNEPEKLLPFYDFFLSQPNLVLTDKDRFNNTPIDFAEMDPRKKKIVERMKEYVSKEN